VLPGGTSIDRLADGELDDGTTRRVFASALAFVAGFSLVFIVMGAGASALNGILLDNMNWLSLVAGGVIVLFGLHYAGLLRINALYYERRVHIERRPPGLVGAFVIGLAFAFGWTPCVGPILATILMVAAGRESQWYGIGLLSTYALGLGLPFLLAAFGVKAFMRLFARFRRHLRKVELAIGGMLVVTGLLILSGSIADVSNWMLMAFPSFTRMG